MDSNKKTAGVDKVALARTVNAPRPRVTRITTIYSIFNSNYHELCVFLCKLNDEEVFFSILASDKRGDFGKARQDLYRLFFNFLSASSSLVYHMKEFVNEYYPETEFKKECDFAFEKFKEDGLNAIIQKIRNIYVHDEIVVGRHQIEISNVSNGVMNSFFINTKGIIDRLEAFKLTPRGKKDSQIDVALNWIKNQNKPIAIDNIAYMYHKNASRLYLWLYQKLEHVNADNHQNKAIVSDANVPRSAE